MKLVEILEWDTNHFGIKVARGNAATPEELQMVLDSCDTLGVKLLIQRCSTDDIHFVHTLERHGFELMDTLVNYYLRLADIQISHVPEPAIVRPCLKTEADDVAAIARVVYSDFVGHFYQDPRLDREKCNVLYAELARNSCLDRNLADVVLVAEMEGKIVGFDSHKTVKSHRIASAKVAEGVMSGVSHQAQGKGVRTALMRASCNWYKSLGLEYMDEGLHVNNYRMQRVLASYGYKIYASEHTFHKWF